MVASVDVAAAASAATSFSASLPHGPESEARQRRWTSASGPNPGDTSHGKRPLAAVKVETVQVGPIHGKALRKDQKKLRDPQPALISSARAYAWSFEQRPFMEEGKPFCAFVRNLRLALRHASAAVVAGCVFLTASGQGVQAKTRLDEANAPDPLSKINRVLFYADGVLDFFLIRPAAMTYRRLTPRPIRTGVWHAMSNLGEPSIAINDLLQGHGVTAAKTVARFIGNTSLGLGGFFDVAARAGLRRHANDGGVTLAKYGVSSGPYIFIPILGPGTARDFVGQIMDIGLNPLTYLHYPQSTAVGTGRTISDGLEDRAAADKQIKIMVATSTDIYASIRSYYLQSRAAQISGGALDINSLPAFDPTDDEAVKSPTPAPPPTSAIAADPAIGPLR